MPRCQATMAAALVLRLRLGPAADHLTHDSLEIDELSYNI